MKALIVATGNAHKRQEIQAILGSNWRVSCLLDFPPAPDVDETGSTFEENSALKALAVSVRFPDALVLADDSGLTVDALGGAPGIHSARFAGLGASDADNRAKLIEDLRERGLASSPAAFHCVLSLARDGKILRQFPASCAGVATTIERGASGFGYDPLFLPDGFDQSFAELPAQTKNRLSHRAAAMRLFQTFLASL